MTNLIPHAAPDAPVPTTLRAGAAKVDITPHDLTGLNPVGGGSFTGVHDRLALRALVMHDGDTEIALVSTDLIEVGDMLPARQRVARELGLPVDHLMITASHSHSAPRVGRVSPGALAHEGGVESQAYSAWVYDRLIEALSQARSNLRPATVAYGAGTADVNVNRDLCHEGKYGLGFNPDGPSDKTVRVLAVGDADQAPIAVVMNYAVHSVVTLGSGQVSADLAGAAAAEVERRLGGEAIALWTLGSVGDQNPRIQLGFPGKFSPDQIAGAFAASDAQGLMIGAEVVRVLDDLGPGTGHPTLWAGEIVMACPVKRGVDVMSTMKQADVDTVDLRLSVLRIGEVALAGINGEVTTRVAERVRGQSCLRDTVVVSMANDRIGYLPEDEAYDRGTFEANGSPIQQGYAERGIADGLAHLIGSSLR